MKGREGASVMERCLYEGKGGCQCDRKGVCMKGRECASVMERCLYEGKGRCQCDGKVSV